MAREQLHFVTGRLAEHSLRVQLSKLAEQVGFDYTVEVLGITVAALMTTDWVAARINIPDGTTRVILPGYCQGNLAAIQHKTAVPVELGPRDLRRLPEFFGRSAHTTSDYGTYDIEILAEINHAPRLTLQQVLDEATRLKASGADLIDVGCDPGEPWNGVGEVVRALVEAGHRVSIDSMNPVEIAAAAQAGAELVLSVNATNRQAAVDWGCEAVVVPDQPTGMIGLEETIEYLATRGVRLRIDPVLEPIGFGFAESLGRYLEVRRKFPDAEILMGIGNLTELTDADSAPINVLLLAICQELGIRSVLTTQVINWARCSVAECDLARRLVHYAVRHHTLPKRIEPRLVMLRDPSVSEISDAELEHLASQIKDHNYRVFAAGDAVHAVTASLHLNERDPFALFEKLQAAAPKPIDASHAFYLGYEMAKAVTALTLGKDYRQDEALDWGFLTRPENSHRLKQQQQASDKQVSANAASDAAEDDQS
jgi:dihydropteroate synthase